MNRMMSREELAMALREFGFEDAARASEQLRPAAQHLLVEVWKCAERMLESGGTRTDLECAVEAWRSAQCS